MERLDRDAAFKLFVLDPKKLGQGPNDLIAYLVCGEMEMNSSGWRK